MLAKKKEITLKQAIINLLIIAIVSLPIIIFVIINTFDLPSINLPFMTIPRMVVNRYDEVTSIFSNDFIQNSIQNFIGNLKIIFIQYDGLKWNALWPFGTTYIFSIVFTFIGIILAVKNRENIKYGYIMEVWIIVAMLLTFVCEPNINRLNIIFFPIIFYTVIGISDVIKQGKIFTVLVLIIYMVSIIGFLNTYFKEDANTYETFEANLEEPIKYVEMLDKQSKKSKQIYVTNSIEEAYIYVLFYLEYNPNDFADTVEYLNPDEPFRQVEKFQNYNFINVSKLENDEGNIYLVKNSEYEDIKKAPQKYGVQSIEDEFNIKEFVGYTVLQGKEN